VAQLVEALCYKPESRDFDRIIGIFRWCNTSSTTMALTSTHLLTKMSTGRRCLRLTSLPPSFADCLEILRASTSCNRKGLCRPVMG
jgi:hypothetical protein